jgi:hypothetical protein
MNKGSFLCWGGMIPFGTSATIWPIVPVPDEDDVMSGRGNRSTKRKPAPVPLCPPQIPHALTRAQTRAVTVGSQQLAARAMAWPTNTDILVQTLDKEDGVKLHGDSRGAQSL